MYSGHRFDDMVMDDTKPWESEGQHLEMYLRQLGWNLAPPPPPPGKNMMPVELFTKSRRNTIKSSY